MKRVLFILSTVMVASHALIAQTCPVDRTYANRNGIIEVNGDRPLAIQNGKGNNISIQTVMAAGTETITNSSTPLHTA